MPRATLSTTSGRKRRWAICIGEKLLNFLEVADTDGEWRQTLPAFVAEIREMFEPRQLADYLNAPRGVTRL
jgi:hypothetical protein